MKRKLPVFDKKAFYDLVAHIAKESDEKVIARFFEEVLTPAERCDVALRWRLLQMLSDGVPHRQISRELGISPCKITRGSKVLKDKNSVCRRIFESKE